MARIFAALCWLYAVALVALWLLLSFGADRWWVATVAMYSPRWLWALPLVLLLPVALLLRRRAILLLLAASIVLLVGPVMRLCVPWRRLLPAGDGVISAVPIRVATLNADHDDLDAEALRRWVEHNRPDVFALQDFTARNADVVFGTDPAVHGWHVRRDGELLLASRFPLTPLGVYHDAKFSAGDGGTLAAYDLQTPAGTVHLFNLHVATPRYSLLAVLDTGWAGAGQVRTNIERRRRQAELARRWVDEAAAKGGRVLVLGDFNMPPDSAIYRQFWSDFSNAFSTAGFGFGSTHFTRHTAVRIDQVLAGPGWRFRRAWVGPFVGSAHRPLVADVAP